MNVDTHHWPVWLKRLLGIHSPTGHLLGTCWCKR